MRRRAGGPRLPTARSWAVDLMLEELRVPLAATAGALIGLGCALLLIARSRSPEASATPRRRRLVAGGRDSASSARLIVIGIFAGILTLVITEWIVLAIVVAGVIAFWNKLFGGARNERDAITRVEGLATWIEALRDTIAGAVGLEQAIPATTINAAPSIRPSLNLLVDRLRVREPLPDALMKFADDLDDPSADLVVASLILNARLRGPGLRSVLGALSDSARDELDLRRRVEASRRSTRRSVLIVVLVIAAMSGFLIVFNPGYVEPYSSVEGQLVLAGVLGLYALAVLWLRRLAGVRQPERFLVQSRHQVEDREEAAS